MKILMILEGVIPTDNRVEKEALSLMKAGHEVAIASIVRDGGSSLRSIEYKGIRIYQKKISTFIFKSGALALQLPFYFNFWKRYINEIRSKYDFESIHIHDLRLASVGNHFKEKYGSQYVLDLHENYPDLIEVSPYAMNFPGNILISIKKWRQYEKRELVFPDLVITVIEEMRSRIKDLGIPGEKICIVPNHPVVEEMDGADHKSDPDYLTLLYSGGINYHRGIQVVIQGLAEIVKTKQNVRLWIVGKGSYQSKLSDLVNELNLGSYVKFWGWRTLEEMMKLQAQADITLIPHLRSVQSDNSSPNKLYEYMFLKKPVLASNCQSVERLLNESGAGLTYDSTDPIDFMNTLNKLNDPRTRSVMGENGYKAVLKDYNWGTSEKALTNAYGANLKPSLSRIHSDE